MILVHVTTVPETLGFFRGQISYMMERGFEIHAVSAPGDLLNEVVKREQIQVHPINLTRRITPLKDLIALSRLCSLFRKLRPVIVHAHTPKGGLLGVMAARITQIPVVIYSMRGLPFDTAVGFKRLLLSISERLTCNLAHRVISVSNDMRKKVLSMGLCHKEKIRVLACGSSNGVDAEVRFNPKKSSALKEIRTSLQIPRDSLVLGYVGRIVRDKGIIEMEEAWQILKKRFPTLFLLLIGPIEPQDPVPNQVLNRLTMDPRVFLIGQIKDAAPFYSAMDLLVLPTYREGFPNTPLEAASMELPVVATNVDGCKEAVLDGLTGLLVPPRNSTALAAAIEKLILNADLRWMMGKAGRKRMLQDFRPEPIWQELYGNYIELLTTKGFSIPS